MTIFDPTCIRRLKSSEEADLAPVLTSIALAAKRSWGYPEDWIREWTPELTFNARSLKADWTWVAFDDERPTGFIVLGGLNPRTGLWAGAQPAAPSEDSHHPSDCSITPERKGVESLVSVEHLWIDPQDHGRGLGRALFEVLHHQARRSGARQLEVYSDPNAEGFYRHMGFEPHGEHRSTVCGLDRRLPILRMPLR